MDDAQLIAYFAKDPEAAYVELLKRYSPVIIRMIRRFMNDSDEVMEVYTSVCERLRSRDFRALREFRLNKEITPWLSVVVANSCRDRFRKKRATSVPQSVISKLDPLEKHVFHYYFNERLPHDQIAETVSSKYSIPCTVVEVNFALDRINELLSINKRWHLLMAINRNRAMLSIEDLREAGFQPGTANLSDKMDEEEGQAERVEALNAALAQLEAEDQLMLLLRFEHGLKASEIAEAMSIENHKYVYTRLRTITNRLRRMLDPDGDSA